ncbi:hypothetical protein E4634_20860 [Mangrovimicrobium sediminis]|uniref:Uncharacterized protein n=1 Tax=Mangrovimicrobium sediminis TaxID=2562682 RepID=A0A4Z0LTR9_9GAMM|nr:hypothetical protein [Haliea sp. SAOS-164]TGD70681.1 hypothetical protein E4634_20860 [Haliea sp. SAOS-164]
MLSKLDAESKQLFKKLKADKLIYLLEFYDLYIGEEGSAYKILSRKTRRKTKVIGMYPTGSTLFALKTENVSPIFFVSAEGEFCYFANSLQQCIQIIISLPLAAWEAAADSSLTIEQMKDYVARVESDLPEEIADADDDERDDMANAASLISKATGIAPISNPLDTLFNNFTKSKQHRLKDFNGNILG